MFSQPLGLLAAGKFKENVFTTESKKKGFFSKKKKVSIGFKDFEELKMFNGIFIEMRNSCEDLMDTKK